jgi:hypothetical protein
VYSPLSKSALVTPDSVYGTVVASATLVVLSVNVTLCPSLIVVALLVNTCVAPGVRLVSLSVVDRLTPSESSVNTIVSAPSVVSSAVIANAAFAVFEAIVKLPVRLTPPISALLTPVIVYGTVVASAKLAVFSVTVSVLPSLTLAALPDNAYVGVILVSLIATVILSLTPFRVIVNVSAPSVSASLAKVNS